LQHKAQALPSNLTLEIQTATLFGEKYVSLICGLYLLGYLPISVFTTQSFTITEKDENLF
jgi:ABC-type transporter Mla subunit MlaD